MLTKAYHFTRVTHSCRMLVLIYKRLCEMLELRLIKLRRFGKVSHQERRRKTFGSKDPAAIKTAFNVLVRPILEYACPVWNPYLVKHIVGIESIQRRATRLICGSDKSYSERLTKLNWSTLDFRREYLCLVQLYKIIHGYSNVPLSHNVPKILDLKSSSQQIFSEN